MPQETVRVSGKKCKDLWTRKGLFFPLRQRLRIPHCSHQGRQDSQGEQGQGAPPLPGLPTARPLRGRLSWGERKPRPHVRPCSTASPPLLLQGPAPPRPWLHRHHRAQSSAGDGAQGGLRMAPTPGSWRSKPSDLTEFLYCSCSPGVSDLLLLCATVHPPAPMPGLPSCSCSPSLTCWDPAPCTCPGRALGAKGGAAPCTER